MPEPVSILGVKISAMLPAFVGALLVNLKRRRGRPRWEAVISIVGGTFGGTWVATAIQAHMSLNEQTFAALSFLSGYLALAACDAILDQLRAADLLATFNIKRKGVDK